MDVYCVIHETLQHAVHLQCNLLEELAGFHSVYLSVHPSIYLSASRFIYTVICLFLAV